MSATEREESARRHPELCPASGMTDGCTAAECTQAAAYWHIALGAGEDPGFRIYQPPKPAGHWTLGPLGLPGGGQTRFHIGHRPSLLVRFLARVALDCVWTPAEDGEP
ncbi:hypothetical protein [Caulobacter sp.]|uniref:hypothetical protein n=1 Tax=Caulobacter sp. TaxID=78 RepID=UPI003BB11FF8